MADGHKSDIIDVSAIFELVKQVMNETFKPLIDEISSLRTELKQLNAILVEKETILGQRNFNALIKSKKKLIKPSYTKLCFNCERPGHLANDCQQKQNLKVIVANCQNYYDQKGKHRGKRHSKSNK